MAHVEQMSRKIHVFPLLVKDLATAHAGIQSNDRDLPEMRRGGSEQQCFLVEAQHWLLFPPLAFQANPCDRVRCNESLVDRPIEQMAEALDIAVHCRFGYRFLPVPFSAVLPDSSLGDS
jgi:hypothetical protein